MDIQGKLHVKFDTVQATEKFQRRQFVVECSDNPMYPQYISFELTQDRCPELDKYKVGDTIEVVFNLRGRSWTDKNSGEVKYFNTLEAWRIQAVQGAASSAAKTPVAAKNDLGIEDDPDDLPF